jgi:pimeloyl-ACP methyl ester carboxylesterase
MHPFIATILIVSLLAHGNARAQDQIQRSTQHTLALFHIDEQGNSAQGDTVGAITDEVSRLRKESGDVIAVLFIHGWRHDASSNDTNLVNFREMLNDIAQRDTHGRKVLGVYVTWPATSLNFWSRRAVADRVVLTTETTRLIEHLDATVRAKGHEPLSRLILIGHSFGARILFGAVSQSITSSIVRDGAATDATPDCIGNAVCAPIRSAGDLVVLLNPAFEASRYEVFDGYSSASRGNPEDWQTNQLPVILAIGADNDFATQRQWPAANPFSGVMNKTTITNHQPFVTHRLECTGNNRTCDCPNPTSGSLLSIFDRTTPASFGCAQLVPVVRSNGKSRSNAPFIVARTGDTLIDGHSGIWKPEFVTFLLSYLDAFDRAKREKVVSTR